MLTLKPEEFFQSIRAGDKAKVKQLVDSDKSLMNATYKDGPTGILFALYAGQRDIAELIAQQKTDLDIFEASCLGKLEKVEVLVKRDPGLVNSYSAEGFPPMALAAYLGQKEIVKFLLKNGAEINAMARNPTGYTALKGSVSRGHEEIAEFLLSKGANVNHRYEGGFSPLMEAAASGNLEMTRLLLANGADVHASMSDGKTALSYATEKGHGEVVALLKEYDARS